MGAYKKFLKVKNYFKLRRLVLSGAILLLASCAAAVSTEPGPAQNIVRQAWLADQHTVWDIDWPNAPVGGPVTAEIWQAGPRRRIEILEAPAPALIGQTLVTDGVSFRQFNRLAVEPSPPITTTQLAPVTPLINLINRLLAQPAQSASTQVGLINDVPVRQYSLIFADTQQLSLWLNEQTGLPLQLALVDGRQQAKIRVRSVEPFPDPPPELFAIDRP
jgi:outer membrane lipoprotein-sorting protein